MELVFTGSGCNSWNWSLHGTTTLVWAKPTNHCRYYIIHHNSTRNVLNNNIFSSTEDCTQHMLNWRDVEWIQFWGITRSTRTVLCLMQNNIILQNTAHPIDVIFITVSTQLVSSQRERWRKIERSLEEGRLSPVPIIQDIFLCQVHTCLQASL